MRRIVILIGLMAVSSSAMNLSDIERNKWHNLLTNVGQTFLTDIFPDETVPGRLFALVGWTDHPSGAYQFNLPGRSDDGGKTWQKIWSGLPSELDLSHSESRFCVGYEQGRIVLFWICRYYTEESMSFLFRSVDSGDSWQFLYQFEGDVQTIACQETKETLLVGLWYGIFKSDDMGETFHQVLQFGGAPYQFVFSPIHKDTVYAATTCQGNFVWESTDSGETWQGIAPGQIWGFRGITSYTMDPVDPNVFYAILNDFSWLSQPMQKTTDKGRTWSGFGPSCAEINLMGSSLYVDSKNPQRMIFCTSNDLSRQLLLSEDGGVTWNAKAQNLYFDQRWSSCIQRLPWQDHRLIVNGTSILTSTDDGENWLPINALPLTDDRSDFLCSMNPANPSEIFLYEYRIGYFYSKDFGASWHPSTGDTQLSYGFACKTHKIMHDPLHPGWIYAPDRYPELGSVIKHSEDYGKTWKNTSAPPSSLDLWHIVPSMHVPGRIFTILGTDSPIASEIWMTSNYGVDWNQIPIIGADRYGDLCEKPDDPEVLYVLGGRIEGGQGVLLISRDGGLTWDTRDHEHGFMAQDADFVDAHYRLKGEVVIDPKYPDEIYLTYAGLWKTNQDGSAWEHLVQRDITNYKSHLWVNKDVALYCFYKRSAAAGQVWSEDYFSYTGSPQVVAWDPEVVLNNQSCELMILENTSPTIHLGGIASMCINPGPPATVPVIFYTTDPSPNDSVDCVECYDQGLQIDIRNCESLEENSSLFMLDIPIEFVSGGALRLDCYAKDRFGNISCLWPSVTVRQGH